MTARARRIAARRTATMEPDVPVQMSDDRLRDAVRALVAPLRSPHRSVAHPPEAGDVARTGSTDTLRARPHGSMRIQWPLIVRPAHEALLEDLLDNAERELTGTVASPHHYSRWIRVLRAINKRVERRASAPAPARAAGDAPLVGAQGGR